jgi:hypothetical protein
LGANIEVLAKLQQAKSQHWRAELLAIGRTTIFQVPGREPI